LARTKRGITSGKQIKSTILKWIGVNYGRTIGPLTRFVALAGFELANACRSDGPSELATT
jgi:hypothetical protein